MVSGHELQLGDYLDGYRFACRCRLCGVTWYDRPADLLRRDGVHSKMYLGEVERALKCPRTRDHSGKDEAGKTRQRITITPIRDRRDHHFIGGLA